MSGYYFKDGDEWDDCSDEYQVLFRPDGTEVTTITEREDPNFFRDLAPVVDQLNRLEYVAQFLFKLLDDIDTADDMAKSDDAGYRRLVQKIQRRRFEVAETDGYTVTWKASR